MQIQSVAVCMVLLAFSTSAQTQQTNLVARWSFEEGWGTNGGRQQSVASMRRTRTDSSKQPVASNKGTAFRVFLVVVLFAVSSFAQLQQTNLTARWSFDAGKGTNVVDSSGNGFHGVLEGVPLPVQIS